jgi:hypothetical protein
MLAPVLNVLSVTVLSLALPCLFGAVLARFGDGRWLWSVAGAALVFSLVGLHFFTDGYAQWPVAGPAEASDGSLLSYAGAAGAVGACAYALVRAWRNKQVAWFLALLVTGALPIVAAIAVFAVTLSVVGQSFLTPAVFQGMQLALALLPIAAAVLLVYGVRLAYAARRSLTAGVS